MSREERTTSQEVRALVAEFRNQWFRIGTSTEPADRPRAEAAIARLYAAVAALPPRIVWCDSPMTAQLVLCILGGRRSLRQQAVRRLLRNLKQEEPGDAAEASPGAWMGDTLQVSVKEALQNSLRGAWIRDVTPIPGRNVLLTAAAASLRNLLRWDLPPASALSTPVPAAAESSRWGSLHARNVLEPALEETLRGVLEALKLPYRETSLRGQQESLWIEGLLFFRDVLGIPYAPRLADRLDCWADVARSCLWWWPYRRICVVSERPAEIHTSDEEQLHNHSGPAVRFRDGWSVWAIGGAVVDEQVVLRPDTQSVHQIRRERNAEVKRIRIERFGWDRYLSEVGATVIDRRRNDIEATRETLLRTPDRERVLVCACPSTGRIYALAVPQYVRTCEGAQNWLSNGLSGRLINSG